MRPSATLRYIFLKWKSEGFEDWDLVKIDTIGDGNCLFHAVVNGFYKPYRFNNFTYNGFHYNRYDLIKSLRQEMSQLLDQKIPGTNKTYYQTINNGAMEEFSKSVPDFRLSTMKKILNSNQPLGYGFMEFISMIVDKDIYILDGLHKNIYKSDENSVTGTRNSVIIHYNGYHYELVGLLYNDELVTYFAPEHPLIKFLRSKL